MERKTLSLSKTPTLKIIDISGDLRITGWDRDEIQAKTSGDVLELFTEGDEITLTCDDDLILSLPEKAQIEITSIAGDARFRNLTNALKLGNIGGDLALREIGTAKIGEIGGDFFLRHAETLNIKTIGNDASIRNIAGDLNIGNLGNDLHLRDVAGNLNVTAGGDAALYLDPQEEMAYQINAGGDILLHLPQDADVDLSLSAGSDLQIKFPNIEKTDERVRTLTLGSASAKMTVSAGGDLLVIPQSDTWSDIADFGGVDLNEIGDNFAENITKYFDAFPDQFFEKLSDKMDTFPDDLMDKLSRKMDSSARKAENKIRRAEQKARRAERKAQRKAARHAADFAGRKTPPPPAPVSDDERLLILKMLADKKISTDDAEKLLAALEA